MKLFIAIAALAALAAAAPQNQQDVQVLRYEADNSGLGSYSFAYELSDGTKREEQGQLKNQGAENEALSVQGSYTWVAPDGETWLITFVADENGFQPQVTRGGGLPGAAVASLLG